MVLFGGGFKNKNGPCSAKKEINPCEEGSEKPRQNHET